MNIQKVSAEDIRKRYENLKDVYWHHSIQLLPDLLVEGGKAVSDLELEKSILIDILNIQEKSVLEICSWTGYHAFAAKKAGARRVVATDSMAWISSVWRGRETFELARDALGLDVEAVEIDPTELPGKLEAADVVLFLGVFYHMHDPVLVLKKIEGLTKDLLIIETHQDLQELNRPAMAFYPRDVLQGDATNWWGPNPECMAELLESIGFEYVIYQEGTAGGTRGYYHAFRNKQIAQKYLTTIVDNQKIFDLTSPEGKSKIYGKSPTINNSDIYNAIKIKS
jgi:tRNA (mo5U34)-methyltransferase